MKGLNTKKNYLSTYFLMKSQYSIDKKLQRILILLKWYINKNFLFTFFVLIYGSSNCAILKFL